MTNIKYHVWEKGIVIPGKNKNVWRLDSCGALIRFSDYGRLCEYGWEIDHIIPKARGGSDNLENLQPLHWDNNRAKGDGDEIPKIIFKSGHNRISPYYGIIFE